ncbi:hypothetical protein NDW01_28105 [Actinoallomurus sp. WRP6H-15]|nr:hypothetical protein [Actinoallomurus soli]
MRADTAILGVCGLSADDGLTAPRLDEVPVKQAMIAVARRRIAVCDASKFTRTGLGRVCSVTDLDVIVTDAAAPAEAVAAISARGCVVRTV